MLRKLHFITVMLLAVLCSPAYAKTLYVDGSSGNDAVSYSDNSAEAPWRTIGRAAWGSTNRDAPNASQAAQAGDIVIVRAGTYSTSGTGSRWGVAYRTANSGRSGAPIVFQADGTVVLTLTSSRGPVIGASGFDGPRRDYITWRGFTVFEANAPSTPDTGVAVLAGTIGSTIEDCVLDGNGDPGFGDNHPGVRIEWSENVSVRNCLIYNFRTSGVNGHNGAGIQIYNSGNVTLEQNEIHSSGSGIFLKAPGADSSAPLARFVVRNNYIHNISGSGIAVLRSPNTPQEPILVYQNIVRDSNFCVTIWAFDRGSTDARNAKIVNNTVYNCNVGVWVSNDLVDNAGHLVQNNIVHGSREYAVNFAGAVSNLSQPRIHFKHNLFYNNSRFAIVHTSNHSLSSWRSTFGQDSGQPASLEANPLFVSASSGDFRLQSNSPALSAGIDYLDLNRNGSTSDTVTLGAYVTGNEVIGRTSGGFPNPPAAPDDVSVE